jgi:hypothetical protein
MRLAACSEHKQAGHDQRAHTNVLLCLRISLQCSADDEVACQAGSVMMGPVMLSLGVPLSIKCRGVCTCRSAMQTKLRRSAMAATHATMAVIGRADGRS